MFRWFKRNKKDAEVRERFKDVLDAKSKAIEEMHRKLDQFRAPMDRRISQVPFDGPERRLHA